jgi:hypothetical protein
MEPIDSQYHLFKLTSLLDKNESKTSDGGQMRFIFEMD